jgi:glycosyltransferase involved in cell wall biosynthesis
MIKDVLSVVIPCKNEENYIGNTLSGLSSQTGIHGTRVIIADAKSTDKTLEVIQSYKDSSNLDIEVIEGGPVLIGRNRGSQLCKTEFILFLDIDHFRKNVNYW